MKLKNHRKLLIVLTIVMAIALVLVPFASAAGPVSDRVTYTAGKYWCQSWDSNGKMVDGCINGTGNTWGMNTDVAGGCGIKVPGGKVQIPGKNIILLGAGVWFPFGDPCQKRGSTTYECTGSRGPCAANAGVGVPYRYDGASWVCKNFFGECTTQCLNAYIPPSPDSSPPPPKSNNYWRWGWNEY